EMRRLLRIQQGIKHLQIAGRHYRDKNLTAAVKEAELAVLADPTNADCHYDYACYLSLSGKREDALLALKKTLQLNPKMADLAKKDGDLSNIRSAASFKKMVEEAEAKAKKK
ncbi:MAG: TPR end-of-group domain-containing protein, partial [Limisphaerales bacterium]